MKILIVFLLSFVLLSSCVSIKYNGGYEPKVPNEFPVELSFTRIESANYFYMYGLILPIFPIWRSTDELVSFTMLIGNDSASCPVVRFQDMVDYSVVHSNYFKPKISDYACWYRIVLSKDEDDFEVLWKGKSYLIKAQSNGKWEFDVFINQNSNSN